MTDLSEEQQGIIEKVEKLMRLANKNPNEAEAAAATAKAQALLVAYNLDMAMVGEHGGSDGRREEAKLKGGAYKYQRRLWGAVARLNFCLYWADRRHTTYKLRTRNWTRYQWHHFIIGRVVNVVATRSMSGYLEQTIERLVRDRLVNKVTGEVPVTELFSQWAVSYRDGAADRVVQKIEERRDELKREEHRKQSEAARAGTSTATALTISSYSKSEEDANMDFIHGEGWSAQRAARRAARAAAAKEAEAEYTRWAAAHPEEARKEEAKRRKEREAAERRASKPRKGDRYKGNASAYWSGYDAAESISIDQQVGDGNTVRKITHG